MKKEKFSKKLSLYQLKLIKLFGPNAVSSVCTAAISVVDSVVSGLFIGPLALATIGLFMPIRSIESGLHSLFGKNVTRLISKIRIKDGEKAANRFIASIIYAVIFAYAIVIPALLIAEKPLINFLTHDQQLAKMALEYFYPVVLSMPLLEILKCLHSAYSVDGRSVLFSAKDVITAITGIVFTLVAVVVFHGGIFGIACGSVLAQIVGYSVDLIHCLSDKCTVHPDFSVILDRKEFLSNVKSTVSLGKDSAMWFFVCTLYSGTINKLFLMAGGSTVLSIRSIISTIDTAVDIAPSNIGTSYELVGNILVGGEDYKSFKAVTKSVFYSDFIIGVVIMVICMIIAEPVCLLMGIPPEDLALAVTGVRIYAALIPFTFIAHLFGTFSVAVGRYGIYRLNGWVENLAIVPLMLLLARFGVPGLFVGIYGTVLFNCAVILYFLIRKQFYPAFLESDGTVVSFYLNSDNESIADIAKSVDDFLTKSGYDKKFAFRSSLMLEECLVEIKERNSCRKNEVQIFIRLRLVNDRMVIIICDNGLVFDILETKKNMMDSDTDYLEKLIIDAFSENMKYDRVIELNYNSFSVYSGDIHCETENKTDKLLSDNLIGKEIVSP